MTSAGVRFSEWMPSNWSSDMASCCRNVVPVFLGMVLLGSLVGGSTGLAQNNEFTERTFVSSPRVRGMGDAGVALLGPDRPFFYNPAHLPHISSHFTVSGAQVSASRNLRSQIEFFNRRLQPAIESNFEDDPAVLERLYRDAYQLGRRPVRGRGAVVLPAFVYSTGGVGAGAGLFAKTALNYRVSDGGLGVPNINLLSRTDVMAVFALGLDLDMIGLSGFSVGGTATRTRRFLGVENKPLDTFTPNESALLLLGNTLQVDVGGQYAPPWWPLPGQLTVGGAAYDLLGDRYDYIIGDSPNLPFLGDLFTGDVDSTEKAQEFERARREFRLDPSYRIGVGYRISSSLGLDDVGLAIDYQGYGDSRPHPLARVHAGVRAEVLDGIVLRTGLSAGYPTGGVGLSLGPVRFDYALHAFEEGRAPGQTRTYVHSGRLMLRIQ